MAAEAVAVVTSVGVVCGYDTWRTMVQGELAGGTTCMHAWEGGREGYCMHGCGFDGHPWGTWRNSLFSPPLPL